jgi:hypothetical protein
VQGSRDRQQQQQQISRHGEPGIRNSRSPTRDWQGDRTQGRVRSRSPHNRSRGGQRDRSHSAGFVTDSRDGAADTQRPEQLGGHHTSTNGDRAPAAAAAAAAGGGGPTAPLEASLFDLRSAPVFAGMCSDSDSGGRSVSPEAEAAAGPSESEDGECEDGEWADVGVGRQQAGSRGGVHQSRGRGSNRQQWSHQ